MQRGGTGYLAFQHPPWTVHKNIVIRASGSRQTVLQSSARSRCGQTTWWRCSGQELWKQHTHKSDPLGTQLHVACWTNAGLWKAGRMPHTTTPSSSGNTPGARRSNTTHLNTQGLATTSSPDHHVSPVPLTHQTQFKVEKQVESLKCLKMLIE